MNLYDKYGAYPNCNDLKVKSGKAIVAILTKLKIS